MPRDRTYSNLTVNRSDYEKLRKEYDKLKLDQSLNTWIMDIAFSGLVRQSYTLDMEERFIMADLKDEGFAFLDKKNKELVQIKLEKGLLYCSIHKNEPCDHKIFASMNPKFNG